MSLKKKRWWGKSLLFWSFFFDQKTKPYAHYDTEPRYDRRRNQRRLKVLMEVEICIRTILSRWTENYTLHIIYACMLTTICKYNNQNFFSVILHRGFGGYPTTSSYKVSRIFPLRPTDNGAARLLLHVALCYPVFIARLCRPIDVKVCHTLCLIIISSSTWITFMTTL